MARLRRSMALIAGVVMVPIALYVALWWAFTPSGVPSNIVDFRPASFQATADREFFYSISNELKYSDQIDPQAPTLMRGHIKNFLVSPDNKKIAAVTNGQLVLVGTKSILRQITAVDSIYREPKPLGQQFFRDDDFQWSKDSRVLYLIRDEYYDSKGSQLFSSKGELWKFDIESGNLQIVLKPFQAYSYFFGLKSGIYFSTPTETGNLQLRYFDGKSVTEIDKPDKSDIPSGKLARKFVDAPFYSFSIIDYESEVLSSKGAELVVDGNGGSEKLLIRSKSYLAVSQGKGFKGPFYCSEMLRSVFLPGDRYFVFNVPYCGNYKGQLLIDTLTGQYQRLPSDSVVYLTLNTDTYFHYRITGGGIVVKKN
jgi:hypothetical protein